jgi:hypothetical protein
VVFNQDTSSEFALSYGFPNYMSTWGVTGITNKNIQFTSQEFQLWHTMHVLNDPTNPDLREFAAHGEMLLMWEGWTDQGTSPFGTLNYYDAVRKLMGASSASGFHVVVPHSRRLPLCGWPGGCHVRFLTR